VNETVYITGGSGLLGVNWALAVRDRYRVVAGLHERNVSLAGVETRWIDLAQVDHLVRDLESVRPKVVIHSAALTNVELCESDPALAYHVNVELAANVARACARLALQLAHISTDHLFSGDVALVEETRPASPINVYARTKAEAENRVLSAHPGALVIRTNFFCWGPSYRPSFSDTILASLQAGRSISLFRDVFFTPILAEVLANAVHDLLDRNADGIFHVTGDERISKHDFGLKVAERFDLATELINPICLEDQPELVRRPHDMSLSNRKVCQLLGRKLGGTKDHLTRLREQQQRGLVSEIQNL
jgi:dTDP-4-dehydrorhamnose reductase